MKTNKGDGMDSMLRGLVIGQIVGDTMAHNRVARPRGAAVTYSPTTGMVWAWNHRSARDAEKAAMRHCQGPQPGSGPTWRTSPSR